MNLDELKWSNASFADEQISKETLVGLLGVNKHKVLKRIKTQLIIESIAWSAFLAVYYDFFDGHLRSGIWNGLLVVAICLLLIHNLLGYQVTNNPINGINILESLSNYLLKLRRYAYLSISARILAILILFGYFLSAMDVFEIRHYWSFAFLLLLVSTQAYLLWQIWSKRIKIINLKYKELVNNS
ncbi:hypothetical protein [Lunatibacter salilacus]|uniref:hypothetical protein n=1 Tax=Lunatibacter salilacus TaxID=2483804 RepID=UPI00131BB12B|nr:hypothetical protein [Lunatibacter salilacus]